MLGVVSSKLVSIAGDPYLPLPLYHAIRWHDPPDYKCILNSPPPVFLLVCGGDGWIWLRCFVMFCATIIKRLSSCASVSSKAASAAWFPA